MYTPPTTDLRKDAVSHPAAPDRPGPDSTAPGTEARTLGMPGSRAAPWGALATSALAACGGGGGGGGSSALTPAPVAVSVPTEQESARFLMQASFGGSYAQVQEVQAKGYSQWIDDQMAMPWNSADSHYQWLFDKGYFDGRTLTTQEIGIDNSLWRKLMSAPDVLRQRVAFALSQIFVMSLNGLGAIIWRNVAGAAYMDLLEKNAFANYADLLKAVSLSPAMGAYLNMKGSKAVKPPATTQPDENYAREVMQLFSIGLYELNDDGSNQIPLKETYQQQDVTHIAAIFTGWDFRSFSPPVTNTSGNGPQYPSNLPAPVKLTELQYLNNPMVNTVANFTAGDKIFFDQTVSSTKTATEALYQVLDYLAKHHNVGPFIGKQLIQRLVCSNPSPAYVKRVTQVFNNDGNGVRGNLKAVIKAILLDTEARNPPAAGSDAYKSYGKLREPALRLVQWARTFNAKSNAPTAQVNYQPTNSNLPTGPWQVGDLSDDVTGLGQSPLRSPTVFNFFRPGYVPPQGDLGANKILAPEFQLCNEVTAARYLNLMKDAIDSGRADLVADYSPDYDLAADATKLVDRYALLLTANTLSDNHRQLIITAVNSITADLARGTKAQDRIKVAILLIMATPEYLIQK